MVKKWEEMNITKTHKVQDYSISSFLQSKLKMDYSESRIIAEALDNEFYIVKYHRSVKGNFLWRISGILHFVLFLFLFCIVCPIKWLLTGLFYFDPKSKMYKFFQKWQDKL